MEQCTGEILLKSQFFSVRIDKNLLQFSGVLKDSLSSDVLVMHDASRVQVVELGDCFLKYEPIMLAKALAYSSLDHAALKFDIQNFIQQYTLKHLLQYSFICDRYDIAAAQDKIHKRIGYLLKQRHQKTSKQYCELVQEIFSDRYATSGLKEYLAKKMWYPLELNIKPADASFKIAENFVAKVFSNNEVLGPNARLLVSANKKKLVIWPDTTCGDLQAPMFSFDIKQKDLHKIDTGVVCDQRDHGPVSHTIAITPDSKSIVMKSGNSTTFFDKTYDIETMREIDCPFQSAKNCTKNTIFAFLKDGNALLQLSDNENIVVLHKKNGCTAIPDIQDITPIAPLTFTGFGQSDYCKKRDAYYNMYYAITFYQKIKSKLKLFYPLAYVTPDGSKAFTSKSFFYPQDSIGRVAWGAGPHDIFHGPMYYKPATYIVHDVASRKKLYTMKFHAITFLEKSSLAICSTYPEWHRGISHNRQQQSHPTYRVVALHDGTVIGELTCADESPVKNFTVTPDDKWVYGITRSGKLYRWPLRKAFKVEKTADEILAICNAVRAKENKKNKYVNYIKDSFFSLNAFVKNFPRNAVNIMYTKTWAAPILFVVVVSDMLIDCVKFELYHKNS
jgi:hypothetical protein